MESTGNSEVCDDGFLKKYTNEKHSKKLLAALNSNRCIEHLCDGVVIIGKSRIPIQKAVLAAASQYFRSVFNFDSPNSHTKSEVDLTTLDITVETFHTLMDYIYTSEIELSTDNIQDVLQASDALLLGDLKTICCDYLEECISTQNCLGILELSTRLSCTWIQLKAQQFIDRYICDVSTTEEFMKLSTDSLLSLLQRQTLDITNVKILECVLAWYKHSPDDRDVEVGRVLQTIFTGLHVRGFEMERLLSELETKVSSMNLPSRGRRRSDVILLCGGSDSIRGAKEGALNTVHCLDATEVRENQGNPNYVPWKKLISMSTPRIGHKVIECGGCVYVFGGENESGYLNSCEKYDPLTNTWTSIADMLDRNADFRVVAIKDNIYIVGGTARMMAVYNIFTNTWRKLPYMKVFRIGFACAALNKTIFVIGGMLKGVSFDLVECFDTLSETWYVGNSVLEKRAWSMAVTHGEEIYLFGGMRRVQCPSAMMHGGPNKICGHEIYSSNTGKWSVLPQQGGGDEMVGQNSRNSIIDSGINLSHNIYLVGKLSVSHLIQTVRCYNMHDQTWTCIVDDPPIDTRSRLAACAVYLPNHLYDRL